jgi:hypothetical protein
VRPTPRHANAYTAADVAPQGKLPPLSNVPAALDRITFSDGVLTIPE